MILRALVLEMECFSRAHPRALVAISAQAWIKCFQIFHHHVKTGLWFSVPTFFCLAVFPVEQISNAFTPILTKLRVLFYQTFTLIGFRINSKNAVMRAVKWWCFMQIATSVLVCVWYQRSINPGVNVCVVKMA